MKIGYALTGSFCTVSRSLSELEKLMLTYGDIVPIVSEAIANTDTRFGKATDTVDSLKKLCGTCNLAALHL